jgi:hypothetical protein
VPLQTSWVDHLFAKLTIRYGEAFLRQWPQTADPALIKADWAEVLDGVSGESLSYALRYLPAKPPNALHFRDLCRLAPAPQRLALEAPSGRADPARVQALVSNLRASMRDTGLLTPAEKCARNIADIVKRRGYMSIAQRQQMEAMGYLKPDRVGEAQQPLQAQQRGSAYRSEVA